MLSKFLFGIAAMVLIGFAPLPVLAQGTGLLALSGNRVLLEAYQVAQSPLRSLARLRGANDFRAINMLRLSEMPKLDKVGEHGEVKRGTRFESKESFRLATFAKIFGLTRQAIINDDLNAFGDAAARFGRAAAETEASEIVALLTANSGNGAALQDGDPIYGTGATRGNKASAGAAIDVTTLGAARKSMRERKDLDNVTPINATPRVLLVGAALETAAEQVLTTLLYATETENTNPFTGKLDLAVEPRLTGNAWRLFADLAVLPVINCAYLDGAAGPQFQARLGWDVLGVEFRCLMDFGCGISDWRGTYLNPGA